MKKYIICSLQIVILTISLSVVGQVKPLKKTVIKPKIETIVTNPKIYQPSQKPKICTSVALPSKVTNPECVGCEVGVSTENLTVKTDKMWQTGSTLRVRIDGGSIIMRAKVVQYANEWSRYANIRFQYVSNGDAEIIVTFGNDGKSWSYVGTDCIDPGRRLLGNFTQQGTTHFGWFDENTTEEEYRRVILHEFGHVLGFKHEQSHPEAGIPWDREKVYQNYANTDGWSRADVDRNVFEESSRNETQFSQYDPTSIMHYAVPEELTIGNYAIDWNTQLSETDKAFAKIIYPDETIRSNKLEVTIVTGGDDLRVNSDAKLFMKFRNGAVTNSSISLNKGKGWGNNSRNTVSIPIPDGIAMTDIEECKLVFTSGKQFEWDGTDNWNVDNIILDYVTQSGSRYNLATRSGLPFVRYYASGETLLLRR
jgi:serralysin